MPLWGGGLNGLVSLPKNLTDEQKTRVYADNRGWNIIRPGHRDYQAGRTDTPKGEVLVSVNSLATNIGSSNITAAYFVDTSYSTGATGKVRVHWDQLIVPTTTGTLLVRNLNSGTTITATRTGNTSSNFIEYAFTAPSVTGIVLSIGAQTITQGVYNKNTTYTTSQLVISTSTVITAGTKYRTVYGANHGSIWSSFTNTSVTTTV
jgi:hypothetical protein